MRPSGVTLLATAVLALLPALAWLQYSWLDQIADADRDRRERTLRTATSQLGQDFESELGKAMSGLQIDAAMAEQQNWAGYATRYQAWADSAISPAIVKGIYFVEGPELHGARNDPASRANSAPAAPPAILAWKPEAGTFEAVEWPAELQDVQTRFTRDMRGLDRMVVQPAPGSAEQSIVLPVIRIPPFDRQEPGLPPRPPDFHLLGFTIVRLNLLALGTDVLPALVRRHLFDDAGRTDYHVAVVEREHPEHVIYESENGAAAIASAQPDASATLLGPHSGQMFIMGRDSGRGGRPPSDRVVISVIDGRREAGPSDPMEGNWKLVATHRAGSLEAAVGAVRRRNFFLSSGILALLGAAIGLIVVSARRADSLAKQQLEFVAAVSHELRTPVSVIGAAAENLADGVVGEPGRVKQYGETIQGEARRLAETVERVLQLAGIAAGNSSSRTSAIPVPELVKESADACGYEIERTRTTLEVSIAEELLSEPTGHGGAVRIVGDVAALRSALQNLISNAIKYGGESRWIRVAAAPAGHRAVRITVEDRGLGMSAEDRKHVFEPFYRGREAVSQQIQGSGLGLHIVRRIVDAHGGTVGVNSEPGKGSTFTIELPAVHEVVRVRDRVEVPHPKAT